MGKKKKRRSDFEAETENNAAENETERINGNSRSKKKKNKTHKDKCQATDIPTLTIAVPGSIIHNAQSLELATRVIFPLSFSSPCLIAQNNIVKLTELKRDNYNLRFSTHLTAAIFHT